jgi:hypothetical protein
VKYRDHKDFTKENKQQDWHYLMAELQAAMLSGGQSRSVSEAAANGNGMGQKKKVLEIKRRTGAEG